MESNEETPEDDSTIVLFSKAKLNELKRKMNVILHIIDRPPPQQQSRSSSPELKQVNAFMSALNSVTHTCKQQNQFFPS